MGNTVLKVRETRSGVVSALRSAIEGASGSVTMTVTPAVLSDLAPALSDAVDRGVTVLLLLYDVDPDGRWIADYDFAPLATVVRAVPKLQPVVGQVDYESGFYGDGHLLLDGHDRPDADFALVEQPHVALGMVAAFQSLDWGPAAEVYVADRDPLPATYTDHHAWAIQGTLALRDGDVLSVTADVEDLRDGPDRSELTGRLIDVRQGLVYPDTAQFPGENALIVESGDDHYSVGGPAAYKEDFLAERVTFE